MKRLMHAIVLLFSVDELTPTLSEQATNELGNTDWIQVRKMEVEA